MKWDQSFQKADKVFQDDVIERSVDTRLALCLFLALEEIHFNL